MSGTSRIRHDLSHALIPVIRDFICIGWLLDHFHEQLNREVYTIRTVFNVFEKLFKSSILNKAPKTTPIWRPVAFTVVSNEKENGERKGIVSKGLGMANGVTFDLIRHYYLTSWTTIPRGADWPAAPGYFPRGPRGFTEKQSTVDSR